MSDFKYEMGFKAQDIVTGFEGTIICRSQWFTGCNTYGLKPTVSKEGKLQQTEYFDENAIIMIPANRVEIGTTVDEKTGGPQETPRQASH